MLLKTDTELAIFMSNAFNLKSELHIRIFDLPQFFLQTFYCTLQQTAAVDLNVILPVNVVFCSLDSSFNRSFVLSFQIDNLS